jgi:CBS domain-containing protein
MSDLSVAGTMLVSAVIGDGVATIAPGATLHDVADALAAQGIGALAVDDGTGGAQAVITERDLVVALSERRDPASTTASDVASSELICCDATSTIADVAEMMMERYVRHVLVEEDGKVIGMVSARDLLGIYASADMEEP